MLWLFIFLVVFLLYLLVIYNRFVRLGNLAKEAFSGVDVQLKRRHDLIPNFLATVKGYMAHERDTFEEVTRLRQRALDAETIAQRAPAEMRLTSLLKNLLAVAEEYPDLKAGEQFLHLQKQLVEVEEMIQLARRYYNGSVRNFNTYRESFPSNIVGGLFGFSPKPYFTMDPHQREAPHVEVV